MQQLYTYETELKPKYNQEIIDYFNDYTTFFNKIVRNVWQYCNHQDALINQKPKLNTLIQNQFGVSKRTAGSIISYVSGRYNSLKALKKYELKRNNSKIEKLNDLISELALKLDVMAMKAHHNQLKEKELIKYKGLKAKDFNKGFVAISEVKEDGNLVNTDKIYYRFKQGDKTTNDLKQLAHDMAIRCKENNMSLAIENLNFGKKKSKTSKYKKDEKYNNDMLHSLAYSKFDEYISRACFTNGVWLSRVNPAYTSYIGKKKYNEIKKLNTHTSASYVIARRGMRFKDAA